MAATEVRPGDTATGDLPQKPIEERPFDDKGHLAESDVPNKDQLHVHSGQILDKGKTVLQTQQEVPLQEGADVQVLRAARPTGADVPGIRVSDASRIDILHANAGNMGWFEEGEINNPPEEDRPEKRARQQSQGETGKYQQSLSQSGDDEGTSKAQLQDENPLNKAGFTLKGAGIRAGTTVTDHRTLIGTEDGAIPGSRVGNPLAVLAENLIGDKVFDVTNDGSHWLKIMSKDKSIALMFDGSDAENDGSYTEINKMLVEFKFPSINPKVAQRHLLIYCGSGDEQWQPCEMYFPPDVSHVQVLLPLNVAVHAEMCHTDQEGHDTAPYMVDFYTNHGVNPRPLEASPLGIELMSNVVVRQLGEAPGPFQDQTEADNTKTFERTAGGSPGKAGVAPTKQTTPEGRTEKSQQSQSAQTEAEQAKANQPQPNQAKPPTVPTVKSEPFQQKPQK